MSFPSTPSNGQQAVVNNITYAYSTSTQAWTRVAGQVTATISLNITGNTQSSSTITGALQVVGGVGVGGNLYVGGNVVGTITTATNIAGGTAGQLHYQSAPNVTAFAGPGTVNQILVSNGTSGPLYTNTSTIQVGYSANALGGAAGSLPYQSAANTTAMLPIGTSGYVLTSNGTSPYWASAGATSVGSASTATNLAGGAAGYIPMQTAGGVTSFITAGTAGQLLVSNGSTATFTTTSTIQVGYSANTLGGAAGSIAYQSGANATTFLAAGTSGQSLRYFGSAPVWSSTGTFSGGTISAIAVDSQSVTITSGGLGVTGDSYFSGNVGIGTNGTISGTLQVNSTNANTGTATSNALYVAGGAWVGKSLVVQGPTTFAGSVTFSGTATYVYSTNTVYTDNLLQLHVPPTGAGTNWTVDDGKDVGIEFNYYYGGNQNGALILSDATKYLTWYSAGYESGTGSFTSATYGTFQTGNIFLTSQNFASSTNTGALVVAGGVGIGQSLYVGGTVTATTFVGNLTGTATQANNINGGTAGQLHYQSAPNVTAFAGPGTVNQILVSNGTSGPLYTNTSTIQVGYSANALGGAAGSLPYQSAANTTAMLPIGTSGYVLTSNGTSPYWASAGSTAVGNATTATNLAGGAAGYIPMQTAGGVTSFITAGTAGQLLQSNGTTATFVNTSTLQVGYAANVLAGAANQIPYQSAANATAFSTGLTFNGTTFTATNVVASGTSNSTGYNNGTGALQVKGGAAINNDLWVGGDINLQGSLFLKGVGLDQITGTTGTFVNIVVTGTTNATSTITGAIQIAGGAGIGKDLWVGGTIYGSTAGGGSGAVTGVITTATNLAGGLASQFAYQTAPGVTSFVSTSSMYVNNAVNADTIRGGTAGQLHYQSAPGVTSFVSTGTQGQILVSQPGAPVFTSTSSIYVGYANQANNLIGGSANQIPYQSAAGATTFGSGLTFDGTTLSATSAKITSTANATSTASGAFQVQGGAGIGGNLFVGGSAYLTGDLYVDGTQFVVNSVTISSGDKTLTLSTSSASAALAINSGLQIGSTSTPFASWLYDGSAYWVSGGSNAGGIKATSTTGASSTNTGALVVAGGAGFGGSLYVGGAVTATMFYGALTGTVSTATNLAGGLASQFAYQTAPGVTSFVSTGSMQVGYSANILAGAAGSLPYQSAANTTAMLAGGSNGQSLRYFGNAPVWSSTGTFSGGTASTTTVAAESVTITSGGLGVAGNSYFQNDLNVAGTMYAGNFASTGTIVAGGVRSTTTSTAPTSATVGDIWYNTSNDIVYRYTTDGGSSYWLDMNGPTVANATAGVMTVASLKAIAAASTSFADFQTRIAAL